MRRVRALLVLVAASAFLLGIAGAEYYLNTGCYPSQQCTAAGTCESMTTYTTHAGCTVGDTQVSINTYAGPNCRKTECGGSCSPQETQTDSKFCWSTFSDSLECCNTATTYTCRRTLPCSTVPPLQPPPTLPPTSHMPAPPTPAVFAPGGAWDAFASTDQPSNAYVAALLSWAAYEDSLGASDLETFDAAFRTRITLPLGGLSSRAYYMPYSTNFVLLETPTSFIVAFRGSESIMHDWLGTDLDFTTVVSTALFGGQGVMMVQGVVDAITNNNAAFMAALSSFRDSSSDPAKPLWFTGHSLGGAMAPAYAAWTQLHGTPVQGVITFASPIMGNAAWRDGYPLNNVTYRYAAAADPVPEMPCYLGQDGHVGTLHVLQPCAAAADVVPTGRRRRLLTELLGTPTANGSKDSTNAPATQMPLPTPTPAVSGAGMPAANATDTAGPPIEYGGVFDIGDTASCVVTSCCGLDCGDPGPLCYNVLDVCTVCPLPGYDVAAHSVESSYLPALYDCVLSRTEQAAVPPYWTLHSQWG